MTSLTVYITESNDDGRESSGGNIYRAGTTLNIDSAEPYAYYRFQNVTIPQGATISSAYLNVYIATRDDPGATIRAEDVDNASQPGATNYTISTKTFTTAGVDWTATNLGGSAWATSPDIKTVIQEITDRTGWSSGNSLLLVMIDNGTGGDMLSRSWDYDSGATYEPYLTVDYTTASTHAGKKTSRVRLKTKIGGSLT